MNRDIHLIRCKGDMTPDDEAISVTICLVPFDRVLSLATGIHRARWGATILLEDETASPHAVHNCDRETAAMKRKRTGATQLFPFWNLAISTPEGSPDITLIEDWGNEDIVAGMRRLEPDLPSVELYSVFENASREVHTFAVRNGDRIVRRVGVSRGYEKRGWHWDEEGEPQPYERPERYRTKSLRARFDRELLFDYARSLGVDLQACLAHRRLARSTHIAKLDPWDPTDAREPTRRGQEAYEAALAAGIGEGWPEQGGVERQSYAQTAQKLLDLGSIAKSELGKAPDADSIAAILREASGGLNSPDSEFDILPDLSRTALRAAYKKDVDSPATRRLEQQVIDLTAHGVWPVTDEEIARSRAEARQRLVLDPLAARHARLCKTAKQPSELLPVVDDVTSGRIPEVDERFRETAVELAFRRAYALWPDDPVTSHLGQVVDRLRAESNYWSQFNVPGSHADAIRLHEDDLRGRREAARRKREEKKPVKSKP